LSKTDTAPPPPKITSLTQTAFGLAGVTLGATSTGVNFFLLLYYVQVALLAGLALAIALIVDGIADPLVGVMSDRLRSRLGRRHPFLFAAIAPMALSYYAIWFPPFGAENQAGLFCFLLAMTIALRLSLTLLDVPTNALIAELTHDYDTRTRLSAAKTALSWTSANFIGIIMYAVWLQDTSGPGSGLLRQEGYQDAALTIGALVFVFALAVPLSLMRFVPYLRALSAHAAAAPTNIFKNLLETYSNPSIRAALASAIFFAAGVGLTQALWVYFLSFFWAMPASAVNAVQIAYLCASLVAMWLLPSLARGRDKRALAIRLSIAFWIWDVAPIALRLVGLMPANGTDALIWTLCFHGFVDGVLFNMVIAIVLSMLTDVVEDNQLRTGRREEGAVLAGQTLVTKTSTALGTLLGAGVLILAQFPTDALNADAVGQDVFVRLGAVFVCAMWLLGAISTWCLTRYVITREKHADNLARVQALS
jgi:glycoside/pentoside/hexuronide:cation symporter, GPH family